MTEFKGFTLSAALGFQLNRAAHLMTDEIARRFAAQGYDITAQDFGILMRLLQEGAITQVKMSELMMRDKATITRRIDRLVKKKLIERVENPEDRRSFFVQLTVEGREALNTITPLVRDFQQEVVSDVSGEDRETVMRVLSLISNRLMENRS